jgi:hypothetical protein
MQPYQERVVQEKTELDIKIGKLNSFIESPKFYTVTQLERRHLIRQMQAMGTYSDILGERISAF